MVDQSITEKHVSPDIFEKTNSIYCYIAVNAIQCIHEMEDFSARVKKQLAKLPEKVTLFAQLLVNDLGTFGTRPGKKWSNFSKLSSITYHCHLVSGRPTYVACWELLDK